MKLKKSTMRIIEKQLEYQYTDDLKEFIMFHIEKACKINTDINYKVDFILNSGRLLEIDIEILDNHILICFENPCSNVISVSPNRYAHREYTSKGSEVKSLVML